MKRVIFAMLFASIAISASGCSAASLLSGVPPVAVVHTVAASPAMKKTMIDIEALYNTTEHAYNAAVKAHLFTNAQVASNYTLIKQAHTIRAALEEAYDGANQANFGAQVSALTDVIHKLAALAPKK